MRSVTSTSCTLRVSRITAASPAQSAPAAMPAAAASTGTSGAGAADSPRAAQVAARPPTAICPSPPILMTRARKQSATPTPVRR